MAYSTVIPVSPISNPDATYIVNNGAHLYTVNDPSAIPVYALMSYGSLPGCYFGVVSSEPNNDRYIGFNAKTDRVLIYTSEYLDLTFNERVTSGHNYYAVRRITSASPYVWDSISGFYNSLIEACEDIPLTLLTGDYPITYRLANCTAPDAPMYANPNDTVEVPFVFPSGYGFLNPPSDVYVTNNGVVIPSTYSNGILTFAMPSE